VKRISTSELQTVKKGQQTPGRKANSQQGQQVTERKEVVRAMQLELRTMIMYGM
jgi:hypothetical protein